MAIKEKIDDSRKHLNYSVLTLTPNSNVIFTTGAFVNMPIVWEGLIGSEPIKIIQKKQNAFLDDFDFEILPDFFSLEKPLIVKFIKEYLDKVNN